MLAAKGTRRVLRGAAVLLLLSPFGSCSTMCAAIAEKPLPLSQGFVSDFARKVSPATRRQIEELLLNFRNRTGIEVAVVTIPFDDMQGYPIEAYAVRLGRQWGVGRDSQKRALLLLVAIKPPNAQGVYSGGTRLEVSRHLEGDVPDILAGELIRKMRDGFVAGRFDQALTTGTQTILATLAQRLAISMEGIDPGQAARLPVSQPVGPALAPASSQAGTSFSEIILIILVVFLVFLVVLFLYVLSPWPERRQSRSRSGLSDNGDDAHWSSFSDSSSEGGGGSWATGDWSGSGGGGAWSGSDFGGFSGGGGDFGGGGASDSGGGSWAAGDWSGSGGGGAWSGSDFGGFSAGGGDFGGGGASDSW